MVNFDNYPGTPPVGAYTHATATVGTTAVQLCTPLGPPGVIVQNNSSTAITVYLGGSTVTTTGATQGIALAQNASITIPAFGDASCTLYCVAASAGALVSYLYPIA